MTKAIGLALAILGSALSIPSSAQTIEPLLYRQYNHKGSVELSPEIAYIFYRSRTELEFKFLHEVDSKQRAQHEEARQAQFTKLHADWAKKNAKYEKALDNWNSKGTLYKETYPKPVQPVEPTLEAMAFPRIEMLNFVTADGGRLFDKEAPINTYLLAVQPGSYFLYGIIIDRGQGAIVGSCLCMGTLKFEAKAGQIVDLGEIQNVVMDAKADGRTDSASMLVGKRDERTLRVKGPSTTDYLPAKLSGLKIEPADFRAGHKLPNIFGILIDRISTMPGVLAYDRDLVVDLKQDNDKNSSTTPN
jgi:hypothetical protein